MNSHQYPFRFEEHPKKKGTCPECGQPNKFRYYENSDGKRLSEDFGRCERVNECGYQLAPTGKALPKSDKSYTLPPQPVQIYPSDDLLHSLNNFLTVQDSAFHAYCVSIGISYEHLSKWGVGTDYKADHALTVFVHRDGNQRITNAKWFAYTPEGKRDKDFNSFSLKQPPESDLKRYGLCLYGEHLLSPKRDKVVMVVESEKTAIIASWFYPEYDWVAVGSCNGLTDAKIQSLFNRFVVWLSDADDAGRNNSSWKRIEAYQLHRKKKDLFPDHKDGYDIADAIRDGQHPEILSETEAAHLLHSLKPPSPDEELADEVEYENQTGLPMQVWMQKEHRQHFRKYGFIEYNNQYFFGTKSENDDTWKFKAVSNFIIKPLLLIQSKSNPKRIYEITNQSNDTKVIDLDPKQFSNHATFCEVVECLGNFVYWGNKTQFIKIKAKLYSLSAEAEEIKTLGYHPVGFYAFANGIQNEKWIPTDNKGYGIVEHQDKQYFLPFLSKIYSTDDSQYENQKKFIYKPGNITFEDYARRWCDTYKLNNNGQIGLLFNISCLFRDLIFRRLNFFPHLFLFGPPQSGKSSMASSSLILFGDKRPQFMLNTGTNVAFFKHYAEFRNALVWFDEYKNTIHPDRIQSLKNAFDGAGHTKSENTNDNRNKSVPVLSGCVISGQEMPTSDNALFTRCILLIFNKTDYSKEERDAFEAFDNDMIREGCSHLTAQLSTYRNLIQDNFYEYYSNEVNAIKESFIKEGQRVDDRIAKSIAMLLSVYQCLRSELKFPFSEKELRRTAYSVLSAQAKMISESKETAQFWKMVSFLITKEILKDGIHYRIRTEKSIRLNTTTEQYVHLAGKAHPFGKKVIFLRFDHVFPELLKAAREQGISSISEPTMRQYLTNSREYIGNAKGIKFGSSTSALAFDIESLEQSIEGFSLEE